jgi:hypothetical protein
VQASHARSSTRPCRVQGVAAADVAPVQVSAVAEVWFEDAAPEVLVARALVAGVGQELGALAPAVGAAQEPDVQVRIVVDASVAAPELDVAAQEAAGQPTGAPARAAGELADPPARPVAVEAQVFALSVEAQDAVAVSAADVAAIPADSRERFASEVPDVKVVASEQGFLVGLAFAGPLPADRAVEVEALPLIVAADSASGRELGGEHCDLPVKAGLRPQLQGAHCSHLQSWHD